MSDKSRIEAGMDWAKEKVNEMASNAKYEADKSKMVGPSPPSFVTFLCPCRTHTDIV